MKDSSTVAALLILVRICTIYCAIKVYAFIYPYMYLQIPTIGIQRSDCDMKMVHELRYMQAELVGGKIQMGGVVHNRRTKRNVELLQNLMLLIDLQC